jgi:FkbM family methyltransferase
MMLTKAEAFAVAYEREPTSEEMARIRDRAPSDEPTAAGQLRSVIACIDRQFLATPITVRFGESDLMPLDLASFRLFIDRADVAVSAQIMATRDYETHLSEFFRRVVKPGMTAIDIGANIGFFTMLFASLVGNSGQVLAFEPSSENCRMLLLNIEANNFRQVKLFPLALSEEMAALYFTPALGSNGIILPDRKETLLDPNCVVVPSMRLDAIESGQVHVIKADIEGGEYRALRGSEAIIRRCCPIVTVELSLDMLSRVSGINGAEFLKWMQGFGYRAYVLGRSGAAIEAIADVDAFFASWANFRRIEDLAFIPGHMDFDPRQP